MNIPDIDNDIDYIDDDKNVELTEKQLHDLLLLTLSSAETYREIGRAYDNDNIAKAFSMAGEEKRTILRQLSELENNHDRINEIIDNIQDRAAEIMEKLSNAAETSRNEQMFV